MDRQRIDAPAPGPTSHTGDQVAEPTRPRARRAVLLAAVVVYLLAGMVAPRHVPRPVFLPRPASYVDTWPADDGCNTASRKVVFRAGGPIWLESPGQVFQTLGGCVH